MNHKLTKAPLINCRPLWVVLFLILTAPCFFSINSSWAGGSSSSKDFRFGVLVGTWVRTDGGYVIRVSGIKPDGQVTAQYFNPRPIHVAEATASKQEAHVKLFIKLQDQGYPGSTYTLFYFAEKDALAGFYYQASMNRTFEVLFQRRQ